MCIRDRVGRSVYEDEFAVAHQLVITGRPHPELLFSSILYISRRFAIFVFVDVFGRLRVLLRWRRVDCTRIAGQIQRSFLTATGNDSTRKERQNESFQRLQHGNDPLYSLHRNAPDGIPLVTQNA